MSKVTNFAAAIDEAELRKNFAFWCEQCSSQISSTIDTNTSNPLITSPTTHTFGSRTGNVGKLHRKILFDDQALTSEALRRKQNPMTGNGSISDSALRVGFADFVFTYLGAHEPYYARAHFPAFGVFVRKEAERHPYCVATRRDLESPDVIPDQSTPVPIEHLKIQFLLPSDARALAVLELQQGRHDGDFLIYWGDPERWRKERYAEDHWKWVFEFHFRDQIPVSNFHAILWPRETMVRAYSKGRVPLPSTSDQIEFIDKNPQCRVINYKQSTCTAPGTAFISASVKALRYYLERNEFPLEV